jgi:hypothetical protein
MTGRLDSDRWHTWKRLARHLGVCAILAFSMLLAGTVSPRADVIYTYCTTVSCSGAAASSGEAQITVGSGTVQIILSNIESNTASVANENSGIAIAFANPVGAVTLTTAFASDTSGNPNNNGVFNFGTNSTTGSATMGHWASSLSGGNTLAVNTVGVGGQPTYLITGPNYAAGGPSGASAHDPNVLTNATFRLNAAGVTVSDAISLVTFYFGTTNETITGQPTATTVTTSVTEPRSIAILLTGLLGLAATRCRLRRA